jgi:4-alpha-glucanotransferase
MRFPRSAGVLLHPTSLPGKFGIGDLGEDAFRFVDFLSAAGQTLWQVLPLGPTGYGDSPYQCFSAFAGNPYLISPEKLVQDGLLSTADLGTIPSSDPHTIDYGNVISYKMGLFRKAFAAWKTARGNGGDGGYKKFCRDAKEWLEDYALFMALKQNLPGDNWSEWDEDIRARTPKAIKYWSKQLADEILFHKFLQYEFFDQWIALKQYANNKGIKIIGDVPIFIAFDSADAWAQRKLFTIDKNGRLLTVAGVPPDYFSPTGQLWGNPLYRWDEMEKDKFLWWRKRISALLKLVDIMRIDHFRGFEAYWEIRGNAETAQKGRWVKAPGKKFFATIKRQFGDLPIIAEDLGFITPGVIKLRDECGFPGMKILQFAFGKGMERKFLPHNHIPNCVVYTGSHDNDTTRAYFEKADQEKSDVATSLRAYLNYNGNDLRFALIRVAYASVADTVIIPMQDILNCGGEARMNFPGRLGGNWVWRFSWDQISPELEKTYQWMTATYERPVKEKKATL